MPPPERHPTGSVVVVGAGGHGREVLDLLAALARDGAPMRVLGVLDDAPADASLLDAHDVALLGPVSMLGQHEAGYVLAVGASATRRRIAEDAGAAGVGWLSLLHPTVQVGTSVTVDDGVIVASGVHLMCNVRLGRHVHCNVGCVVSHDCRIGEFVTLSPGVLLNGGVQIGEGAFLGSGAIVLPGRRVGAGASIAAGAVVNTDVPDGATARGVPARW